MARTIARTALIAVLLVCLLAMFSWGHRGHSDDIEAQADSVSAMAHHHAGMPHHGQEESDPEGDESRGGMLSLLGVMVLCGGMLIRIVVEFLRPLLFRVLAAFVVSAAAIVADPVRSRWRPIPSRLRPTSLLLNRIAVLRI
ncbi:hypothetical protein [Glycomyces sp. NPDC021274]|uniref:hypothetical protein n=1 Tax=Glycomyces sp. NPDC021274 TaxID=3155120 RepID=UPI0034071F03